MRKWFTYRLKKGESSPNQEMQYLFSDLSGVAYQFEVFANPNNPQHKMGWVAADSLDEVNEILAWLGQFGVQEINIGAARTLSQTWTGNTITVSGDDLVTPKPKAFP